MEHRVETVGVLDTFGESGPLARRIPGRQGLFGDAAQPRQRRAQIVRDIVERAPHARHDAIDPVEHRVDEAAQFAERIGRVRRRHAHVGAPRADDAADGVGERAHGLQTGPGDDRTAGQGDHDHQRQVDDQHAAEATQQFEPAVRALAHLQERAVLQAHRRDLQDIAAIPCVELGPGLLTAETRGVQGREIEAPPLLRHAEEDQFLAGPEQAHEDRTG